MDRNASVLHFDVTAGSVAIHGRNGISEHPIWFAISQGSVRGVERKRESCLRIAVNAHFLPVELAKAYRLINHGPTVLVSSAHDGVENVMAASWACGLDTSPPKVTVVIASDTKTRELIEKSSEFVLQVPTVRQAAMTHAVGSLSLADEPAKLAKCGVDLFRLDGRKVPFVAGCSAWLYCKVVAEPHVQTAYDLFIGEVTGAWADDRVFHDGHWHYESAAPEWRSLHYIAGGHFYAIGDPVRVNS